MGMEVGLGVGDCVQNNTSPVCLYMYSLKDNLCFIIDPEVCQKENIFRKCELERRLWCSR